MEGFLKKIGRLKLQGSLAQSVIDAAEGEGAPHPILFQGMHLPTIYLPRLRNARFLQRTLLYRPLSKERRLDKLNKLADKLVFTALPIAKSPEGVALAAIGANECCQRQNLYLFWYAQNYAEKHFPKKLIVDWRLPRSYIAKQQLSYLLEQMRVEGKLILKNKFTSVGS